MSIQIILPVFVFSSSCSTFLQCTFLFFVFSFDSEFGLYFSALYGIVFLACLLVETHELEVTVHLHTKITVTEQLQY